MTLVLRSVCFSNLLASPFLECPSIFNALPLWFLDNVKVSLFLHKSGTRSRHNSTSCLVKYPEA